jgi:hypothetical protein
MTTRSRERIDRPPGRPFTERELQAAKELLARIGRPNRFEDLIAEAEAWARRQLDETGLAADGRHANAEYGTFAWLAEAIVHAAGRVRTAIECNDAELAARQALHLGALIEHSGLKSDWEGDGVRGRKNAAALRTGQTEANRQRARDRAPHHGRWQECADAIWSRHPSWSVQAVAREAKKQLGLAESVDTIRKRIRKS